MNVLKRLSIVNWDYNQNKAIKNNKILKIQSCDHFLFFEGLLCTGVCPSLLRPTTRRAGERAGTARWPTPGQGST